MDTVYHHGIKGMKWGIRRTPEQLGHKIRARKVGRDTFHKNDAPKHDDTDNSTLSAPKRRRIEKEFSNEELDDMISRLGKEKKYKELVSDLQRISKTASHNTDKLSSDQRSKNEKEFSNEELDDMVSRLGKEKRYKELRSDLERLSEDSSVDKDWHPPKKIPKSARELSDEKLDTMLTRLEKEKRYKNLLDDLNRGSREEFVSNKVKDVSGKIVDKVFDTVLDVSLGSVKEIGSMVMKYFLADTSNQLFSKKFRRSDTIDLEALRDSFFKNKNNNNNNNKSKNKKRR